MNDFSDLYIIRDSKPEDRNLILSTFLRGLYYGDSWFSQIPKDIFMNNYKKVIAAILDHPNTIVKVACLPDDIDVILGYSILGDNYKTIHWVYVKNSKLSDGPSWRKKGIGKSLTPLAATRVTHLSTLGKSLLKSQLPNTIFNPFLP